MPRYSEDVINEVFSENDIVDYVSQYVKLKKSGRDYSGLCPFHREKSPSFHVSQDKQLFHCFGCGASGNLVQFVMRIEGLDFVEALKLLAERAGIVLPEEDTFADNALHQKKQRIYAMNQMSARFFYANLTKDPEGKKALAYFFERKIAPKTINVYGLGYAKDQYDSLYRFLLEKGFSDDEMIEAGLVSKRDGRVYDRFRNRVMFPIIDLRGNVIGFGGRIMGAAEEVNGFKPPKYLNSMETPVFNKGRNLFSLNLAKKSNARQLILVEGYMDVISTYQAGVPNVVATLGTALTENQAKLLMKYCAEILICYDSDEAGQKATIRAIEIINGAGGRSRVIQLKGAKDPDEYIKAHGVHRFIRAVEESLPSTEYRILLVKSKYNLDSPDGKVRFVEEAADALLSIQDAVEVDAYINKIAEETEISREAIYSEYKKRTAKNKMFRREIRPQPAVKSPAAETAAGGGLTVAQAPVKLVNAEKTLLNLITKNKRYIQKAALEIPPEEFSTHVHRIIAENIYQCAGAGRTVDPALILNQFTGDEVREASDVFYNMEIYDDDEMVLEELIRNIKREKIQAQILAEKNPQKLKTLLEMQKMLGRNTQ